MNVWLFGYGSLIWRPEIEFLDRQPARLRGWERRFWQGSHDHRGIPNDPGRVVTLIRSTDGHCDGMAYLVAREQFTGTFEALDHREKNGYQRVHVSLDLDPGCPHHAQRTTPAVVYIAHPDNHAFLGPAPLAEMAAQITNSAGPSGSNLDYLVQLASSLRELDVDDPHVFELEAAVRGASSIPGRCR